MWFGPGMSEGTDPRVMRQPDAELRPGQPVEVSSNYPITHFALESR